MLAALALNQITGSSVPQGVAAVLIGLVLIRTSLRLGKRSHDFLVGAWPLTSAAQGDRAGRGSSPALTLTMASAPPRSSRWYAASSRV